LSSEAEKLETAWHHVSQRELHKWFEIVEEPRVVAVVGNDERNEHLLRAVLLNTTRGFADSLAFGKPRFDGFELDAIATQLDLRIHAAVVEEPAVRFAVSQVARPIDSSQPRMLGELLFVQFGSITIASRQADPANTEFAQLAITNFVKRFIQHPGFGQAPVPNRDRLAFCDSPRSGHVHSVGP
jgi:hypothetical protein